MKILPYEEHPAFQLYGYYTIYARHLFNELNIRKPSGWYTIFNVNKFTCQVCNVGTVVLGPEGLCPKIFQEIRISEGVPKLIYDLLMIVLSDNSLFPNIGKSAALIQVPNIFLPDYEKGSIIETSCCWGEA